jgi:CDP-diacylglycerol--glycerol-3-phosphate 3-phosphatidyltransferase
VANALSGVRLVLAAVLPWLLVRGGALALVAWSVAAVSDYVDGPVARRQGTVSRGGAILDNVADIVFVLGGLATAAALGLVSWLVPASITCSAGGYAIASARAPSPGAGLARSRLGHWAGVCNYACLGLVSGSLALPGMVWPPLLMVAGAGTAAINLAAVATRLGAASRAR